MYVKKRGVKGIPEGTPEGRKDTSRTSCHDTKEGAGYRITKKSSEEEGRKRIPHA